MPPAAALRRSHTDLAPLLAALPAALLADPAHAIDPAQTQVILPDQYQWKPALPNAPAQSVETVPVFGATDKPGPYVVLIKWHPGYMSAPRTYVTDRLCFVISGTWWVNSGENFEPEATVPVPAGGFVQPPGDQAQASTQSRPPLRLRDPLLRGDPFSAKHCVYSDIPSSSSHCARSCIAPRP